MTPGLSSYLNISRWLAALLVLVYHVRHLILVDYADLVHPKAWLKGLYALAGLGNEAVIVFFVISGFLVGGLTLSRWRQRGPDLAGYLSARISRLYTVLVPALLVGVALDWTGLHHFNASEVYTNAAQYQTNSLSHHIDQAISPSVFVGNLLMLQGVLTTPLGSNGPLWSLANEWWYYCVFALAAAALTGRGAGRLPLALGALVLVAVLPAKMMLWGLIWLLGLLAHAWLVSAWWRPPPAVGTLLFLGALLASRWSRGPFPPDAESHVVDFTRDLLLGLAYVVSLVSASRLRKPLPGHRLHDALADFSYTAYLCHFPIMLFAAAVAFQCWGWRIQVQADATGLAYFAGLSAAVYGSTYAMYWMAERHTPRVRARLDRLLGRS